MTRKMNKKIKIGIGTLLFISSSLIPLKMIEPHVTGFGFLMATIMWSIGILDGIMFLYAIYEIRKLKCSVS